MQAKLILEDKTILNGQSFGAAKSIAGEVVFSTGMTGYPESFTDPSWSGQILVLTYPLIGNYGVPDKKYFESKKIQIAGLVISDYIATPSHFQNQQTLATWLQKEGIPALVIKDTRALTQKIREQGTMLGKIVIDKDVALHDPNTDNLVAMVSTKKTEVFEPKGKILKTIVLIDCGTKNNIIRCLVKRGVHTIVVPWDFNPLIAALPQGIKKFDGILISNGPGDPKLATATIETTRQAIAAKIPLLGICLGNQILALAAGGNTTKLKYGHRSQNQPCTMIDSPKCYITTHNHGFTVNELPTGFKTWFENANDGSNEGIKHEKLPIMSVQFHPEATPGPVDTEWIFDYFLEKI